MVLSRGMEVNNSFLLPSKIPINMIPLNDYSSSRNFEFPNIEAGNIAGEHGDGDPLHVQPHSW